MFSSSGLLWDLNQVKSLAQYLAYDKGSIIGSYISFPLTFLSQSKEDL